MAQFLSDDWFNQVAQLSQDAGELNLPPALQSLVINLQVTQADDHVTELALAHGKLVKGNLDDAETSLKLDAETLKKVFLEFDMSVAMSAFMQGKIQVFGDMSKLMTLQTARPSAEQKELFKKVLAVSQF